MQNARALVRRSVRPRPVIEGCPRRPHRQINLFGTATGSIGHRPTERRLIHRNSCATASVSPAAIDIQPIAGQVVGEKKDSLSLKLAYGDLTLMVPADNAEDIGLRDVINDEEVEEVFAVLRKKEARMPTNWSRRFKNHVEKLKSGDIYQVAEVVRNLSIREADKGLSAGEKRMLARARQILVSELTFALNVDEEAAEARLDEVLKGEDKPAPAKKAPAKKAAAKK